MKTILFYAALTMLVAVSAFAGGVGVGNAKQTFRDASGFSVQYDPSLSLAVESAVAFRISNEKLVQPGEEVSSIHFQVSRDESLDAVKVAALAAAEHPDRSFGPVKEPGAEGVYSETRSASGLVGFYYLLTTNHDLVTITITAYAAGNGLTWIAPIVNSFVYDVTPPIVFEVRLGSTVWEAGSRQKVYFRATDDFSGINLQRGSIAIDIPGHGPSSKYWLVQDHPILAEGNDWYSVEFDVGNYVTPGEYVLDWVGLEDLAKNLAGIASSNGNREVYYQSNKAAPALPVLRMTVTNPGVADADPPRILEIKADSPVWEAGSTHDVLVRVADDASGVALEGLTCSGLTSTFEMSGTEFESGKCGKPRALGGDWYALPIQVGSLLPPGEYAVNNFDAQDGAGNRSWMMHVRDLTRGDYYGGSDGTWLPRLHVQVKNSGVIETGSPVLTEMRLDSDVLKPGDSLRIHFHVLAPIGGVRTGPKGFEGRILPVEKELGLPSIFSDFALFDDGGDWYHVDIPVNAFASNGHFVLDYFFLYGNAGTTTLVSCGVPGEAMNCHTANGPELPEIQFRTQR